MRNSKGQFIKGIIPWNKGTNDICKPNSGSFKKGKHYSVSTEFKKGKNTGKENIMWKGNDVGIKPIHSWVVRYKGKAKEYKCVDCPKQAHDWSNIDHSYKRKLNDYVPRCQKCHRIYDYKHNLKPDNKIGNNQYSN